MKKELKVEYLSGQPTGEISLAVNGKRYDYQFPDKSNFESYWESYKRNKGRLLQKIKSFCITTP
jgi:hypothetical protein